MPIRFLSEIPTLGSRPDIQPLDGAHAAKGPISILDPKIVRANLAGAVKEITAFLEECESSGGVFALDEVEMTLHMDQAGEVNIIFGKAGMNMSQGMRLIWKRQKAQ